jgi:hypothetical protein
MVYASKKWSNHLILLRLVISDGFYYTCIEVRVVISLVVFPLFFGVKYFSTFSTHILSRSCVRGALAFDDLAHFSTSAFKTKQKMLKLVCADNSMTHYFRPACKIIVAIAKLFISICGCYNASTRLPVLNSY